MPDAVSVGVIGVGSMGGAIVERLLALGYRVSVWDVVSDRIAESVARGASPTGSAAELVSSHEFIIASLPSPQAVENTFTDPRLVESLRPGSITIDMSTVGPNTSRKVYRVFSRKGAHYLDAPVSGGPRRAAAGKLTISVGGDYDAFLKGEPLLKALGEKVFYVGGPGSGSTMKLINQLLVFAHSYAAMEALVLCKALNVDPAKMYEVVTAGSGNSFMFQEMVKLALGGQLWGGRTELLIKDIRLTSRMAVESGLSLSLCRFLSDIAEKMDYAGLGGEDAVKGFLEYVAGASQNKEQESKSTR
ncbi:MAG: NAD(P)-dependent oxidoreductase [Candidatus Caldarchaeum sp.]